MAKATEPNMIVLPWYEACTRLSPYVVRISTPAGQGTGCVLAESDNGEYIGIGTATHVIEYADYWRMPIRIESPEKGVSIMLTAEQYLTVHEKASDASIIVIAKNADLSIAETQLAFFDSPGQVKKEGVALGWLGYPNVEPNRACFFRGYVSAWLDFGAYYLVDGVAINGVSGAPVIDEYCEVVGLLSAYRPNLASGQALPGLSVVRPVEPLVQHIKKIRNLGRTSQVVTPPPPPPPSGVVVSPAPVQSVPIEPDTPAN